MISGIKKRILSPFRFIYFFPQRQNLIRRSTLTKQSGKVIIIVDLGSTKLHINYVRDLLQLLIADPKFMVMVTCTFSIKDLEIPYGAVIIRDPILITGIPAEFLLTMEAGVPVPHHQITKIIHIPHSLVSTHVIYPEGAFDHFDYIFCAGPHHMNELKEMLKKRGVKNCTLIPAGYEVVDRLMTHKKIQTMPPTIVFAPSWGPNNALSCYGDLIVKMLIEDYCVIVRPHIMSLKLDSSVISMLKQRYDNHPHFILDTNADSFNSLSQADLVLSDWSGFAFEYALAQLRPVLFINVPMKVFNPNWARYLENPGIESTYRNKVGIVLEDITKLRCEIENLTTRSGLWKSKIMEARDELLYNPGICADVSYRAFVILAQGARQQDWVDV